MARRVFYCSLGAKVLAVDLSADKIAIARTRQLYYEEPLEDLDIIVEQIWMI